MDAWPYSAARGDTRTGGLRSSFRVFVGALLLAVLAVSAAHSHGTHAQDDHRPGTCVVCHLVDLSLVATGAGPTSVPGEITPERRPVLLEQSLPAFSSHPATFPRAPPLHG